MYKKILCCIFVTLIGSSHSQLLQASKYQQTANTKLELNQEQNVKPYAALLDPRVMLAQSQEKLKSIFDGLNTAQLSAVDPTINSLPTITSEEAISLLKYATYTAEGLVDWFTVYQSASKLPLNFFSLPRQQFDMISSENLMTKGYGGLSLMAQEVLKAYQKDPLKYDPVVIDDKIVSIDSVVATNNIIDEMIAQATFLAMQLDKLLLLSSDGAESALGRVTQDLTSALSDVIANPNDPQLWAVLIKQIDLVNIVIERMQSQWLFVDPADADQLKQVGEKAKSIIIDTTNTDILSLSDLTTNITSLLSSISLLNGTLLRPILDIESSLAQGVINVTDTVLTLILNSSLIQDLTNFALTPILEVASALENVTNITIFNITDLNPAKTFSDLVLFSVSLLDINNLISTVTNLTVSLPTTLTNILTSESLNLIAIITDLLSLLTQNSITNVINSLSTGINHLVNSTLSIIPNVANIFSGVSSLLSNLTSATASTLTSLTSALSSTSSTTASSLVDGLINATSVISGVTTNVNDPLSEVGVDTQGILEAITDAFGLSSNSPFDANQVSSTLMNALQDLSSLVNLGIASSLSGLATTLVSPTTNMISEIGSSINPENIAKELSVFQKSLGDAALVADTIVPDPDILNQISEIVTTKANKAVQENSAILEAALTSLVKVFGSASALALTPVQTSELALEVLQTVMSPAIKSNKKRKLQQRLNQKKTANTAQELITQSLPVLEADFQEYTQLKMKECAFLYNKLKEKITASNVGTIQEMKKQIDLICETKTIEALKAQYQKLSLWKENATKGLPPGNSDNLNDIMALTAQYLTAEKSMALKRAEILKTFKS